MNSEKEQAVEIILQIYMTAGMYKIILEENKSVF